MKQKRRSIYSRCILSVSRKRIFLPFCFVIIGIFLVHLILSKQKYFSFHFEQEYLLAGEIPFVENLDERITSIEKLDKELNPKYRSMCTTQWYKQLQLEFGAFSVNHFEKVMFLMDDSYKNTTEYLTYKCVFFQFGTNITLKAQLLERFGGNRISDPNGHTLFLQCLIPSEAINPEALIIHFMLSDDYANGVNISICRSYHSSFNFVNSRIYIENEIESKLKNVRANREGPPVAICTQTSLYDLNFPLWINYHYKMGIDHFYIYDHDSSMETRFHQSLKSYIDYGIITIVPWYINQWSGFEHHSLPREWVSHQIWSENDCIQRYGHLYSWMLISDVDEFVFPMGNFTNFKQLLNIVPAHYCALQVLNYNFRGLLNDTDVEEKDRPKRFVYRQRLASERNENSKNFVRPHLIYYFAVHQVTLSLNNTPVFYADVYKQARLHHYRAIRVEQDKLSDYIRDTSILPFLNAINESVSSIITN